MVLACGWVARSMVAGLEGVVGPLVVGLRLVGLSPRYAFGTRQSRRGGCLAVVVSWFVMDGESLADSFSSRAWIISDDVVFSPSRFSFPVPW